MENETKTTMSVMEMGRILGLKKTDAYWLVHKQCFETILVQGKMRVSIESFEHWYANQIKHKKVDGTPPGEELRASSYSIPEMAELLGVSDYIAYDLIKRCNIETFEVDTWMRVRKDVFEQWYRSQTRYRTPKDRARDAALEEASMSMPQMARLLGITRNVAYGIIRKNEVLKVVVIADRKRVTIESFERWYRSQNKYHKVDKAASGPDREAEMDGDSERKKLLSADRTSFTVKEAALLIGVPSREIYRMIEEELLDSFAIGRNIRIRRASLEWGLSPQDTLFGKEGQ